MKNYNDILYTKLKAIENEMLKIDKIIEKQESNSIYDDSLYDKLDKLEDERQKIKEEIN